MTILDTLVRTAASGLTAPSRPLDAPVEQAWIDQEKAKTRESHAPTAGVLLGLAVGVALFYSRSRNRSR